MVIGAVDRIGPTSRAVLDLAFDGAPGVRDGAVVALLESNPCDSSGALAVLSGQELSSSDEGPCFGHDSLADALAELVRSARRA